MRTLVLCSRRAGRGLRECTGALALLYGYAGAMPNLNGRAMDAGARWWAPPSAAPKDEAVYAQRSWNKVIRLGARGSSPCTTTTNASSLGATS